MSCCSGSSPIYFWKHLDIVRHIEFKNAFPQIRSREHENLNSNWLVVCFGQGYQIW